MSIKYEIIRYAQDKNPNPHFHEYYEMLVSLNNEGKFFIRESEYRLHFGTILIMAPFDIHYCFCHGDQEYDRYIIHFSTETLRTMSTVNTDLISLFESAPSYLQIQNDTLAKMLGMLECLAKPVPESLEYGEDVERNIHFENFLIKLAKIISIQEPVDPPILECKTRINEIIHYIHHNYNKCITLESISKEFFISKSRLSQIFKGATGFSIGNYIITYRIKRACKFLKEGMQVKDVSATVGFHTAGRFIQAFKKRMGCSPSEFAKNKEWE